MSLDPDVNSVLAQIRTILPIAGSVPAVQLRSILRNAASLRPPGPEMRRIEEYAIATPAGPLPVRIYLPKTEPIAVIDYMHGGGWTVGSMADVEPTVRKLADRTSCAVVSVDYRLAPEFPFPAAVDDAMAAMDWIAERIPDIAGKGVPLIVAGDSAGANLAAVISQLARDRGRSDIALQILIYPAIDGDIDARALDEISPPFLSKAELSWFFDQYVPNRALRTDPRFAPGRASNFSGLPAALVLTAENDLLRHEAEDYGRKLVEAGVPVLMKRYLGTIHGFFTLDAGLKHCAEAHADIAAFIRAFCRRAEEN